MWYLPQFQNVYISRISMFPEVWKFWKYLKHGNQKFWNIEFLNLYMFLGRNVWVVSRYVSVCMYEYMNVCIYACMYVCMHVYHISTSVLLYTYLTYVTERNGCYIANISHTTIMLSGHMVPKIYAYICYNTTNCNIYFTCYCHVWAISKYDPQMPKYISYMEISSNSHRRKLC